MKYPRKEQKAKTTTANKTVTLYSHRSFEGNQSLARKTGRQTKQRTDFTERRKEETHHVKKTHAHTHKTRVGEVIRGEGVGGP